MGDRVFYSTETDKSKAASLPMPYLRLSAGYHLPYDPLVVYLSITGSPAYNAVGAGISYAPDWSIKLNNDSMRTRLSFFVAPNVSYRTGNPRLPMTYDPIDVVGYYAKTMKGNKEYPGMGAGLGFYFDSPLSKHISARYGLTAEHLSFYCPNVDTFIVSQSMYGGPVSRDTCFNCHEYRFTQRTYELPLSLQLNIDKRKWEFNAGAGIALYYAVQHVYWNGGKMRHFLESYYKNYNTVKTIYAHVNAGAGYKISDNLSLFIEPEYKWQIARGFESYALYSLALHVGYRMSL